METRKLIKNGYDMIYLSACALHGKVPSREAVCKMDLKSVYNLSVRHSMQAVCFMALESLMTTDGDFAASIPLDLLKDWRIAKGEAIRNNVLFENERNRILAYFEQNGIWYMLLKGSVIEKYYSRLGMRQMCDVDILFDIDFREQIHDYMLENGYLVKTYNNQYPDAYVKAPAFLFELHFALYTEFSGKEPILSYYTDIFPRLIKDSDNNFGYHFSDEDLYIYNTTHAYKHYTSAGNGVRSLMDIFAFVSKKKNELDWQYIKGECEKLLINDYEASARNLAFKLFSKDCINLNYNDVLTDDELEMLLFCLGSGVYGTTENRIRLRMSRSVNKKGKQSKLRYVLGRVFPDMEFYRMYYPFIYKHRILIPFFIVYRMIRQFFKNFKKLAFEFKLLLKK